MSNLQFLRKILRLKGMRITHFRFTDYGGDPHVPVKPCENSCRCVQWGCRGRIVVASKEGRSWKDIALLWVRVVLWYLSKDIKCATHGRGQEVIPWAAPYSRITYGAE